MNSTGLIILFVILLFSQVGMAQEKWFVPIDVGIYMDSNDVKLSTMNAGDAKNIFLLNGNLSDEEWLKMKVLREQWNKNKETGCIKKWELDGRTMFVKDPDQVIQWRVHSFSSKEVRIVIVSVYGHARWHRYDILLKEILISRTKHMDEVFDLVRMEALYGAMYQGIGYGTSFKAVIEQFGEDLIEAPAQTMQLKKIYFPKCDYEVVLQDGIVKYISKGKPSWMSMQED